MKSHPLFPIRAIRRLATWLAIVVSTAALAGPGAHGPNGEHLEGPAQPGAVSALPRLEAKTELFELVATLGGGELSILIDRFDTNEPVLNARVEVESGSLKAAARFHGDHGDYAVDDPALLKALAAPGEHALVFTVAAGDQTDLLDGTLRVEATQVAEARGHTHSLVPGLRDLLLAAVVVFLITGVAVLVHRRRREREGELQ
jgi:hypothetical protein